MSDTPININLPEEEEAPIPVAVPQVEAPAPIAPEVADKRATKIKYGLDQVLKKSKEEIFDSLNKGEEGSLRLEAASEIDRRKRIATEKVIGHIVGAKGGPLSPSEALGIASIMSNMTEQTDPSTVFEEAYGKQFIGVLDRMSENKPDSPLNVAKREAPAEIAAFQDEHSTLIAKREYANTIAENIEAEVKEQGWVPYLADLAKQGIPLYTDVKMRGNADVSIFAGISLGANLEEQRKSLLRLPMKEFKAKLDEIATKLRADNPQVAADFVKSIVGMSSDDVFLKSVVLPLDVTGIGIGKLAATGGRKILAKTGWIKDAEKAVVDVAKEAANPNASKSTIEAAAGDLKESAVTRATTDLTIDLKGAPRATEKAIEALPETLRTDLAEIKENPGRLGQDLVNRIVENTNTITTNILSAVKNIGKVERLPEIMTNELAVRAIQESIKNTYKSLKNAVLDVSKPYKEPVANTYLVDMKLGKNDGTYFESRTVAENYAKFHGLIDAEVVEGTDKTFSKAAVIKTKLEKNIKAAEDALVTNQKRLDNPNTSPEARVKAQEQVEGLPQHLEKYRADLATLEQKVTVEQQGLGYYVKITKPINETDDVIRSFIAETKNTKIPEGPVKEFLNAWFGKVRTPEEVLSLAERQNRLSATYTPSIYFDIMKDNAKTISKIATKNRFGAKRKKWDEWKRVLENGQQIKDPNSKDEVGGYFFKSPAELEQKYLEWFKRLPDEDEIVAYFEFKRGMEIDRIFRNLAEHRNQQRVGAETHKITFTDETGKLVSSPEFSGVTRKTLSSADDNIAIVSDKGDMSLRSLQRMSTADKKELQKEIDNGTYKFVELYRPEARPLSGFGDIKDERIRFVLAKQAEVRELDWNQVPRRGGGHVEYDYDWYIKQASVKHEGGTGNKLGSRFWYEGDVTIMPIQVRSMGAKVANHLNTVRKLLKDKNEEGARAYSNTNLHIDWDTVKGWFTAGPDANGKFHDARLSLNEPIHVIKKGESIGSVDKELERRYTNFKDGTREGSLARQSQVEYTAERDAYDIFTLEDVGTRAKPLYQIAQANMVDPITTMNRGLARIAKSNFLDDYKTMSVEHWLKQASKYLKASDSEIWHSPFFHFNEAEFRKDAPPEIKEALLASRYHTQQLMGQPSSTDSLLHSAAQKLYDSLYDTFGTKGLVIDPAWMLPKLKDPFGFTRGVIFNMKLGLFNVPQMIVQAGNYANIYGIAGGRFATPGTLGAQLHFWSTVNSNPAIIKHLDKKASQFHIPGTARWRPGEFEEAWKELQKTGFGNVGSEYAVLDNPMSEKVVSDGLNTFLDWGQYFFKQGERNAKYGAWYTAYKEFREVNPIGRITDADRASILQRADLLNVNMSRASSSALHRGLWSIPTQFYTYQIRLMELFYGTRLTGKERVRMLATNAALYGIPMSAGLTGAPVVDYLRNKALEQGYIVGDNWITSLLMEGAPSMLTAVASGKGDYQKGTFQDVGPRFGTKGLEFLGGLNRTDKGYLDIVGGAAYSTVKGTLEQSDGLVAGLAAMLAGDSEKFPMTVDDLADIFKEVSSANTALRTLSVINSGRWISKKEAYLADASPAQAIFSAVSGLKDQKLNDIQTMTGAIRSQKEYDTETEKRFYQEFRRGVLIMNADGEQGHKFWNRAVNILEARQYPEDRRSDLIHKAVRDNESILEKVTGDYYLKKVPDARKQQGFEIMQRMQELRNKGNQ